MGYQLKYIYIISMVYPLLIWGYVFKTCIKTAYRVFKKGGISKINVNFCEKELFRCGFRCELSFSLNIRKTVIKYLRFQNDSLMLIKLLKRQKR